MTPLQKLPMNVGDLGKLIVATGFENLPKVQKIAQSGHTELGRQRDKTKSLRQTGMHRLKSRIKIRASFSTKLDRQLFS